MRGPQKSPIASARPVCRRPTAPRCASPARNCPRTCARTWILHSRRPNRCAQVTSMTVGRAKRAAREREANKAAALELATGDAPIDASPASHTAASSTSTSPSRRPRRKVAGKRKRGRPPLSPAEKVASMERTRLNDRARRAPRGEGGSDQRKQQPRRDQSQPAPSAKVQPPPLMCRRCRTVSRTPSTLIVSSRTARTTKGAASIARVRTPAAVLPVGVGGSWGRGV